MNEDISKNKKPAQEQFSERVEVATEKDWEAYKYIRLHAISSEDVAMFGAKQVNIDKTKPDEEWKKDLSSKDMFTILSWSGSEPIGMVCADYIEEENLWYLSSAYTKEDTRGKIFPKKVLTKIEDEVQRRGGTKILIGVKTENDRMARLAALLGFQKLEGEEFNTDSYFYMEKDLTVPEDQLKS